MKLDKIEAAFEAYYRSFPQEAMNDLKWEHTRRVVANARAIMAGENFPEALRIEGEMAAWLHDIGRFRQFEQYHTFSDSVSVNHALLSCGITLQLGWLDEWTAEERNRILRAIELHNLKELPPGLTREEELLAHVVRDADKLDIFTVLDEAIRTDYLPTHPEVYWGLPFTAPPSVAILKAIEEGMPIDYKEIKSFADFVFIQVAWCNGGLYFKESCKLALARQEVEFRCDYLVSILPAYADIIQASCTVAKQALERKVYGA